MSEIKLDTDVLNDGSPSSGYSSNNRYALEVKEKDPEDETKTITRRVHLMVDWADLENKPLLGNVSGPASSTDNAIARFDGTTGKIIQDSRAIINDDGKLTVISEEIMGKDGLYLNNSNAKLKLQTVEAPVDYGIIQFTTNNNATKRNLFLDLGVNSFVIGAPTAAPNTTYKVKIDGTLGTTNAVISSGGFIHNGLTVPSGKTKDDYMLLAGGGSKALTDITYNLPLATSAIRGGLKIGYTSTQNDLALTLSTATDSIEQAYVTLPSRLYGYNNTNTTNPIYSGYYFYKDESENGKVFHDTANFRQAATWVSAYNSSWAAQIGVGYYKNVIAYRCKANSTSWDNWIELADKQWIKDQGYITAIPPRLGENTYGNRIKPNDNHTTGFAYWSGSVSDGLPANVGDAEYITLGYNNSTWAHQLLFKFGGRGISGTDHDGKDLYTRIYNSNTGKWSDWYTILTSGNFTSVANNLYLPLAGGTMTGVINLPANVPQLNVRPGHGSFDGIMTYQTAGNEAWLFTTKSAVTSFMFVNGEDTIANGSSTRWASLTPGLQIKNNCVSIGELIADGASPEYKLKVAGAVYASEFKRASSSNDYVLLGGGGHKPITDFATSDYSRTSHYLRTFSASNASHGNDYLLKVRHNVDNNDRFKLQIVRTDGTVTHSTSVDYANSADTVGGFKFVVDGSVNMNDATTYNTNGAWVARGVSNGASGNHSFVMNFNSLGTPFQLEFPDSTIDYIYKRHRTAGTTNWSEWRKISAGYADSAGNADTVDNEHASAFAHIAAHNNLTASGNEFTFASSGFSGAIWLNYRTAGGANGNITEYKLGNGAGGALGSIIHTGNIGSQSVNYATTAGSANSVAWSNISGKPDSFTPSTHTHISLKSNTDNRSTNTIPNDYNGVFKISGLKTNAAIGLDASKYEYYSCLLGIRGWSDSSGGYSHEIAFTGNGYLMHRSGSTTSWSDWKQLAFKDDIPTVNNAKLTIKKNGTDVASFTANSSTDVTANITVPTKVSELSNDSGFITSAPDPTNYYWANVSISSTSSTSTNPTFATVVASTVRASSNNSGYLGTSRYHWNSAYINNIYGNLSGNASSSTKSSKLVQNTETDSSAEGGLTWFNADTPAGASVNTNDGPSANWWYILRNRHTNTSNNYYTDLAIPFTNDGIYYKIVRDNAVQHGGWVRVIDSLNIGSQSVDYANTSHYLRTFGAGDYSHGGDYLLKVRHNVDGNDRFKLQIVRTDGTVTHSTSVDYANSAGNADTVDGYHASSLWRSDGATWNPSANVTLSSSNNGDEWSFDIHRNGHSGTLWHVWDSSLSTMLGVTPDNGHVTAPYGFEGGLVDNPGTIKLYVERTDEVNFGGSAALSGIHFGYRAKDSRPIPSTYYFGTTSNLAGIRASNFHPIQGNMSGTIGGSGTRWGSMYVGYLNYTSLTNGSDIRIKTNIEDFSISALPIINNIKLRNYQYKTTVKLNEKQERKRKKAIEKLSTLPKTKENRKARKELNKIIHAKNDTDEIEVGLIAQELEKSLPKKYVKTFISKIDTNKNSGEYTIKTNNLIMLLWKAVQEQQEIIDKQQQTLDNFASRLEKLEKLLGE